jgi:hypothetical protein
MTSEVDTRALSRRFHAQAQRERDAGLEGVAKTYQEIADALDQLHDERDQERAARERAEAALRHISENSDDVYDGRRMQGAFRDPVSGEWCQHVVFWSTYNGGFWQAGGIQKSTQLI